MLTLALDLLTLLLLLAVLNVAGAVLVWALCSCGRCARVGAGEASRVPGGDVSEPVELVGALSR